MPNEQISKIIRNSRTLYGVNSDWRSYFQDLADFVLPRKAWVTTPRITGQKLKFNFLYDSTAIRSLKIMAAGFHHNLTNPSTKWFGLRAKDEELMNQKDVQMWFKSVEDKIFSTLNSTNFDSAAQEFYSDVGCFGTADILTLEDPKTKVRFRTIAPGQLGLEEDDKGRVNGVHNNFKLKAQQAYDAWGENAGKAVIERHKEKPYEEMEFLHYVGPRYDRDPRGVGAKNLPFKSCWISLKDEHLMQEGGFESFPHHVGRFWKDDNECFGFSPAMDVLPDIKLVNAQQKTVLRAGMKHSDPPLDSPGKGYTMPLNLNPGAMNYRDPKLTADQQIKAMPVISGSLPIGLEMIQQTQKSIEEGFYVPLFRALSMVDKTMTVPEVQRRITENMILLGPVVGRFTQEVWSPLILRVFEILWKLQEFPQPPDALQGADMEVIYLSPLAKAQRESDIYTVQSFLQDVAGIATIFPQVQDKINPDKTVDYLAKIRGVSPEILSEDKEVQAVREQRAKAEQQQQQMIAMSQTAQMAKTGAEANKALKEGQPGAV